MKLVHLLAWGQTDSDSRDTAASVVRLAVRVKNPLALARDLDKRGEDALRGVTVEERIGCGRIGAGFGVHVNYTPDLPADKARIRRAR